MVLGIYFEPRSDKWRARFQINGRRIHLGRFQTEDEAIAAYQAAKRTAMQMELQQLHKDLNDWRINNE